MKPGWLELVCFLSCPAAIVMAAGGTCSWLPPLLRNGGLLEGDAGVISGGLAGTWAARELSSSTHGDDGADVLDQAICTRTAMFWAPRWVAMERFSS